MYIQLNGQVIYYEKTGEGSPIILAHGNGETHKIFDILIPELSRKHTVYALDTRGHGESASPEQYHYSDMAEDIAAFVHALDLTKPAFYGFSDLRQQISQPVFLPCGKRRKSLPQGA